MLKQGSVADVKAGLIKRPHDYVVVTMRYYPRFFKKELRDEFICVLAPVKELLKDFNDAQKRLKDHNGSFAEVDYENRFDLSKEGMDHLKRLAVLSKQTDVYLICICASKERCHREMLLLLAKERFRCKIDKVYHSYPDFEKRIEKIGTATD